MNDEATRSTLSEARFARRFARATLLPELYRARGVSERHVSGPVSDEADQRVSAWQAGIPLDDDTFNERLAAEGLDRGTLRELLAERETLAARLEEPWHETLRAALDRVEQPTGLRPAKPEAGLFATALDGFVAVAWERVLAQAPRPVDFDIAWDAIAQSLQDQLREMLLWLATRTLVLEMNVARLRERLQGETPAARGRYYVDTLLRRRDEWETLFDEYQGLARMLCTTVERWVGAVSEVLLHLSDDFPRIVSTLWLQPPQGRASLVELLGGLSDPHCGGRGVWKLAFAVAHEEHRWRIVYKPRPLAVDVHFQHLLAFCNEGARNGELRLSTLRHGSLKHTGPDFPPMPILRVVDAGEHGWVEYVEQRDCPDEAAVERFYVRQGANLALMHILDAVDMFEENLIARGEEPVIVDLEPLFHADLPAAHLESEAIMLGHLRLRNSVLETGLLPGRMWGNAENEGVNIGGMSDGEARVSPNIASMWEESGTDTMHIVESLRAELPLCENVPRVDGAVAPVTKYSEALIAGLEAMLRFLETHADVLLAEGGAIAAFANDQVRHIVRPTTAYFRLLAGARHPDRLRDLIEHERLFDLLWRVSPTPILRRLIPLEKADLRPGDIPYFTTRPGSCHLWDSRGNPVEDVFPHTAMHAVVERLRALDAREIDSQAFITRAALSAVYSDGATFWPMESTAGARVAPADSASTRRAARAIELASQIGQSLSDTAIAGAGNQAVSWLGMGLAGGHNSFRVAPLGADLYSGTTGVALFLAHLGHLAGEERFTRLAERAALATRTGLRESAKAPSGGFIGVLSQLYGLAHLGRLWNDPSQLPRRAEVHALLDQVEAALPEDTNLDVMHGAAGAILSLLALHEVMPDERALDLAVACGRHLASRAVRGPEGCAWITPGRESMLLGFSHGTAGAACALFRLASTIAGRGTEGARAEAEAAAFAELAREALRYERAHFDASAGNWPDLREGVASPFKLAWCHGAPGVALSRLSIPTSERDSMVRHEVEIAAATILSRPVQKGHTLCHGELGNLLILDRASHDLGLPSLRDAVDERLDVALDDNLSRGPRCGFDFPGSAPALMDGISGIGYAALCLTHPGEMPLVLNLSAS